MKQVLTDAQWDQRLQEAPAFDNALNPGAIKKENVNKSEAAKAKAKKEGEESYKFFKDEGEFMKDFKVWVAYPLERTYSRDFQRRYEAFCCGWLNFWDKNISMESKERLLYIKWNNEKGIVILYISNETPRRGYRVTLTVEGPGDPPVVPPPPPPDKN